MAVTLRLSRMGRRNRPYYRLRASDSRSAPSGVFIEELGHIDPLQQDPARQAVLKKDRIEHWLKSGAKTSDTVRRMLKKHGIGAK